MALAVLEHPMLFPYILIVLASAIIVLLIIFIKRDVTFKDENHDFLDVLKDKEKDDNSH